MEAWKKPWNTVSVTQLNVFKQCKRLWALSYGLGLRPPSSPGQQTGKILHKEMELWLRDGKIPEDPRARICVQHWPTPKETLLKIEEKFKFYFQPQLKDVQIIGVIDVFCPDVPLIGDHKFTKNLKWALNEKTILNDPQANIYAAWFFSEINKSAKDVKIQWVYSKTQGTPDTKVVFGSLEKNEVFKNTSRLCVSINEMQHIFLNKISPWNIPPHGENRIDYNGCNCFGGCYFKDKCSEKRDSSSVIDFSKVFDNFEKTEKAPDWVKKGREKVSIFDEPVQETVEAGSSVLEKFGESVNPPESKYLPNVKTVEELEELEEQKPKKKRRKKKEKEETASLSLRDKCEIAAIAATILKTDNMEAFAKIPMITDAIINTMEKYLQKNK